MAVAQEDRIVTLVTANGASLLRLARRHSLCDDDAADAYQHTLELYLKRRHRLDDATAAGWLKTVCKHEAMRIRAARLRVLTPEEVDWDARPSVDVGDAAERAETFDLVARAAEALRACAPEEARVILLRADGSTYREISEQCGFSESRVSRSLSRGRARFLRRFAAIESGEACKRFAPVLSAIVDGEATPDDFLAVRPHLRHCAGCRTTLRALYETEPALGALLPAGALLAAGPSLVARFQAVLEAASTTKAAAVVASAATVAAGGAAAVDHVRDRPDPVHPVAEVARHAPRERARPVVATSPARTSAPAPSPSPPPTVTASPTEGPRPEAFPTAPPRSAVAEAFPTAPPLPAAAEAFGGAFEKAARTPHDEAFGAFESGG